MACDAELSSVIQEPGPEQPAEAAQVRVSEETRSAEDWLVQLEVAADDLESLQARVRLRSIQGLLEDETTRFGELNYQAAEAEQPARFAVAFDKLMMDGVAEPIDQRYIFDGRWLLDVNAQDKTATRRELAADDASAVTQGEGPFPIPLNLNQQRVLSRFDVLVIEDESDDPRKEPHVTLRLIPKQPDQVEAEQIDLTFHRETGHPLRAATLQEDGDETIIDLFKLQRNTNIPAAIFDTALPEVNGWQLQTVPLN